MQDIVPLQLGTEQKAPITKPAIQSSKALKIKAKGLELEIYNGCDRYIVYAILKELGSHAG